jgi:replication factor A1
MEEEITKIENLTPEHKKVNVHAKVVKVGEEQEIPSRFGAPTRLSEVIVGDDTATVVLTLWRDQIGSVGENDTIMISNGYVSLVKGHMRLNVGKYGKMTKVEEAIEAVNEEVNVSDREYEQQQRRFNRDHSGGDRFGDRGRGRRRRF